MWRNKISVSTFCVDVCLRVPKRHTSNFNLIDVKTNNYGSSSDRTIKKWRSLFEKYEIQNKLNSHTNWYQVASNLQDDKLQRVVSNKFGGSLYRALSSIFPEKEWKAWKFQHHQVPHNFWLEQSNQQKFFEDLGRTLGIKTLDDWYDKLSVKEIINHGGGAMIAQYNNSPIAALMAAYPKHNWTLWKFTAVPKGYWDSKDNVKEFLNQLSEKLSIKTMDDWYYVDHLLLSQYGAFTLVKKYRGLYYLLKEQYPQHPWDRNKFKQVGKKAQRWLAVTLKKMFPNEEILEDYLHPKAVFPSTKRPMQLDIYLPSRSLAFEYQGVQHYQDTPIFSSAKTYQQRDEEKRAVCAANNIKLVEVPYWWNRTEEELLEIMQKSNPPVNTSNSQ